ncbi:MAG: hypothetical protein ACRYG8_23755, partial [Janthinobacterium lividum]
TLYRDPKVLFGGIAVGGIRISHMSHINEDTTVAVAETKGARKPVRIKVLRQEAGQAAGPKPEQQGRPARTATPGPAAAPTPEQIQAMADWMVKKIDNLNTYEEYEAFIKSPKFVADRKLLNAEQEQTVAAADQAAAAYFAQGTNVPADDGAAPIGDGQEQQG